MSTWESSHDMNWKEQLCYDMGYKCGKNAAVVNGQWEVDEFGHYCTVCKEYAIDEEFYTCNRPRFCANCGAKMY